MLTATLGGLIKDFRLKKRLSQMEVSLRIGWNDSNRLSRIEQGRVDPTKKTLEKIMEALMLDEGEKREMLMISGILPSWEEAQEIIDKLGDKIASYKYPVILMDYAWNIFYFNEWAKKVFKLSEREYKDLMKSRPNYMEFILSEKLEKRLQIKAGYSVDNVLPMGEHEVALFKYELMGNAGEKWYSKLILRLNKNKKFRKLWKEIKPYTNAMRVMYEFEYYVLKGNWRGKKEALKFDVFSVHPAFDFRFWLCIHQPADDNTYKFFQNKSQKS